MNRAYLVLIVSLLSVFAVATEIPAGNRLYVGNLSFTSGFSLVDKSTGPTTPVLDAAVSLDDARAGTLESPGGTLPADSSQGIVDPGPDGFGRVGFLDVFYTGAPNDFPADSFFDVFVDFSDPVMPVPLRKRAFNIGEESAPNQVSVDLGATFASGVQYVTSLVGQINPDQPGLSFTGLEVVQGSSPDPLATGFFDIFTELHFDGTGTVNPSVPLFRITFTPVPEPSSLLLCCLSGGIMLASRRRWGMRLGAGEA